jgi:thioredoxin 1
MEINDQSFEQEVLKSETPVVVDFWAEWCQPCKRLAPVLDEIAQEKDGQLRFVKLDIEENPKVPQKYGIMNIPTLLVFKNGQEVSRIVGFFNKNQLLQKLNV